MNDIKDDIKDNIKNLNNVQVAAELNIRMYSNGTVNVNGPIDNFFLFRNIMNLAERAVLEHIAKKNMAQPNIIVPKMGMPQGPLGRN